MAEAGRGPGSPRGNGGPTVGALGEAGVLARILPRLAGAPALLGPGDDAALVAAPDGCFAITVDTLVQDQDFRLEWASGHPASGFDVGWKAAAQNLSDVNAMGAVATSAVISLTLPAATPVSWVEDFADGFAAAVRGLGAHRCAVAGGDLGRGREISATTAVTGDLEGRAPVLRSGARPGDAVAVCGRLGAAAAGLALLESSVALDGPDLPDGLDLPDGPDLPVGPDAALRELVRAQCRPHPPLDAGPRAAAAGATAMMDLSDGLARDVPRLARASGVDVELDPAALETAARRLAPAAEALGADPLEWVVTGGEDFGLLACFDAAATVPDGFAVIGSCVAGTGTLRLGGRPVLEAGWDHFEES
ncbi:thiamine-phosphate kinase [Arthrobacter halodurans]|uniref:Thiamine-monophosphate kinase n=1 Tax=Arthrobacter halodurans TaxID=516699 RepID=A0ABV4UJR0_9MICC